MKAKKELLTRMELVREAKEAIRKLLVSAAGASVEILGPTPQNQFDFGVVFTTGKDLHTLACEVKSRAWPNELYAVSHRLRKSQSGFSGEPTPVVIAPYVSKQAADACIDLGLSWADFSGNCELRVEGAFVKIEGRPSAYKGKREGGSLYTPQASQVLLALLVNPHRAWTLLELAEATQVSLGQVANVKKRLQANGWIESAYGKTLLTEPRRLLDDWSLHYQPKRRVTRLFSLDLPRQLESRLHAIVPDFALTEFSGAERYVPFTRHQRVAFYVREWEDEYAERLNLKIGDGAFNVTVYETGAPILFTEEVGAVRCASPITTYLDLKLLSGRGQDGADNLLESVLLPRWG